VIVINLKTYEQAFGAKAVRIAEACAKISKKYGLKIAVCPQAADIRMVREKTDAVIFAQHVDAYPFGKYTGWINIETMMDAGITGSLINHSEHKLGLEAIKQRIERCKQLGLVTVVCTADIEEAQQILNFQPDFIAIEPPELIGGNVSVSSARPELIANAAKLQTETTRLLVGAGVRTAVDVETALRLGAVGILSASEVAKSANPEEILERFASAFLKFKTKV